METISRILLTFLLNAVWQVALVAALASVASWLLRAAPAQYRHRVWVAALVLSCGMAVATPVLLGSQAIGTSGVTASTPAKVSVSRMTVPAAMPAIAQPGIAIAPSQPANSFWLTLPTLGVRRTLAFAVAFLYLAVLIWQGGRFLRAWLVARALLRTARPIALTGNARAVALRCREVTGATEVRTLVSADLQVPVTAGWLRPAVILPESLLEADDPEMLASALGHELVHVARRDYLLNCLYMWVYLPISFHPAAALMKRRINQTRELRCDEFVTERLMDPAAYARSLVELASHAMPARALASLSVGITDGDILEERIMAMLHKPKLTVLRRNLLVSAALVCFVVPCLAAAPLKFNIVINSDSGIQEPQGRPAVASAAPDQTIGVAYTVKGGDYTLQPAPSSQQEVEQQDRAARRKAEQPEAGNARINLMVRQQQMTLVEQQLRAKLAELRQNPTADSEAQIKLVQQTLENLERKRQAEEALINGGEGPLNGVVGGVIKGVPGGVEGGVIGGVPSEGRALRKMYLMENSPELEARRRAEREMQARERTEMAAAAKITMEQAIQTATSRQPGSVVESRLTKERGQLYYIVTVVPAAGGSNTVWINAVDGTVFEPNKEP